MNKKKESLMLCQNETKSDNNFPRQKYQSPILCQGTRIKTQKQFILSWLTVRPATTLQLRQAGICSPAARIMELRNQGYNIQTIYLNDIDQSGVIHGRIANYILSMAKDGMFEVRHGA